MQDDNISMCIDQLRANGAGITYGGRIGIGSMVRKGAVVACEADALTVSFEKLVVEFENESLAEEFEEAVKHGTARIILEENKRKEFWEDLEQEPEMKEKFNLALISGNEARIEELLTELCNEYEIYGYDDPEPETSGITRLAIMHDHGVNAFGFKGREKDLKSWMARNWFDPSDLHHYNLNMYD